MATARGDALRLAALGAASILGQCVLFRELAVVFYGRELSVLLGLAFWLLGTAAGSAFGRWRPREPAAGVRRLLLAGAAALMLSVVLARGLRPMLGGVTGAELSFPLQWLGMAMVLLPPSVSFGLAFPWAAASLVSGGGGVAEAYALESAGGLAGGALASILPWAGVPDLAAALLAAALAVTAAGLPHGPRSRALSAAAAAGILALFAAAAFVSRLDVALTRLTHPDLVASRDTLYARVTVTSAAGQAAVFENDALAFETEGASAEELAHLTLAQVARPRSILILGGGIEGLIAEALRHRPAFVDYVEMDAREREVVARALPERYRRQTALPGVRAVVADPRRFVERGGTWDAILLGMPEPESARTNRLYTAEFFAACARHLSPEGALGLRLRGSENLWTPLAVRRLAAIRRALAASFADVAVFVGESHVVVASRSKVIRDPPSLAERMRDRDPGARLVTPAYAAYLAGNDRLGALDAAIRADTGPANTDGRPVCYGYTMLLGLSRFFPELGRAAIPEVPPSGLIREPAAWLGAVLLALAASLARRRPLPRRAALVGGVALVGMGIETVILLDQPTRSGALFRDLGLLLAAFMAGLFAGAYLLGRQRAQARGRLGLALVALMGALVAAAATLLASGPGLRLETAAAILAADGALVAATFAWAAAATPAPAGAPFAPLYAADVAGGCLGSVAAALVLVPVTGLPGAVEALVPLLPALFIVA